MRKLDNLDKLFIAFIIVSFLMAITAIGILVTLTY